MRCRSWPGRETSWRSSPPGRQQRTPPRIAHRLDLALARLAPLPALAGAAKPQLGDDAGGGRVVDEVATRETDEGRGAEAMVNQRLRRLGPEAVAPPGLADPIADLGLSLLALDVADGADKRAFVLDAAHELVVAERGDPQIGINE